MLRKIGISIATAVVVAPGVAAALSVGSYQLNSHLNQPLDLRVQLSDVRGLDEHEIVARLATKREFDNAGIDFDPINNSLRFTVTKLSGDRAEVRIVSREAVREPFVSLLVEYVWPRGRMLREYNLLLNPSSYAAAGAAQRAPEPQRSQPTRPQAQRPQTQTRAPAAAGGARQYTIRANDTLWEIAAKNRPSRNVSVQQTMLAIQDKNPSAFINNNINLLKSGVTLQLPSENEVRQRSGLQATAELERQASERTTMPKREAAPAEQGRVTLLADDEPAKQDEAANAVSDDAPAAAEPSAEAAVEETEPEATAADAQRFTALEEELQEAEERLQLKDQRISELQQVLLRLQKEGIEIDPALLLGAEEADADTDEFAANEADAEALAEIEAAVAEADAQAEDETSAIDEPSTDTSADTVGEPAAEETADAVDAEEADNATALQGEEPTTLSDADGDSEDAIAGLDDSFDLAETPADSEVNAAIEGEAETAAAQAEEESAPAATVSNATTESQPNLAQRLLENSMLLFALLGALLLAVLWWLFGFIRRRNQNEDLFAEVAEELPEASSAPAANSPDVAALAAEAAAFMQEQRYAEAVPVLRSAVQQSPADITLKETLLVALFNTDKKAYQQEVTKLKGMNAELDSFIDEQKAQQGAAKFGAFAEVPIVTETFIGDDGDETEVAVAEEAAPETFTFPVEEELGEAKREEENTAVSSAESLAETEDIDQLIAEIESIDGLDEQEDDAEDDELAIIEDEHNEHDTGLGLARAMINMGNEEDARDILAEVLRGGNEKQQEAAQQLLDNMSR